MFLLAHAEESWLLNLIVNHLSIMSAPVFFLELWWHETVSETGKNPKSCASFVCRQQHGVETQTSNSFIGWRSQKRRFWVDVKTLLATYANTYCINVYIFIYTQIIVLNLNIYIYTYTHPFVNLCVYYIYDYICVSNVSMYLLKDLKPPQRGSDKSSTLRSFSQFCYGVVILGLHPACTLARV